MKKIIQLLYILFAVAAFSACSDDNQGEVVSQDLAYQLDANYGNSRKMRNTHVRT